MDHLRSRRGRRVGLDEHVARGRAEQPGGARCPRVRRLAERPVRPPAPSARGGRDHRHGRPSPPADLDTPRPPRLGGAGAVRRDDRDAALRRPPQPARGRSCGHDGRHRRTGHRRRGDVPRELAGAPHGGHDPGPRGPRPDDPGDHARVLVLGRRQARPARGSGPLRGVARRRGGATNAGFCTRGVRKSAFARVTCWRGRRGPRPSPSRTRSASRRARGRGRRSTRARRRRSPRASGSRGRGPPAGCCRR